MSYLGMLTRRGIRASLRHGKIIWLEPGFAVTDDVRQLVREHRDDVAGEIRASAGPQDVGASEIVPDYSILMVATNLDSWEADDPRFGYEVMLDVCYRQLDPEYYAYLRHRLEAVRKSASRRKMRPEVVAGLKARFQEIHTWAVAYLGEQALLDAIRRFDNNDYIAPSEDTFKAARALWENRRAEESPAVPLSSEARKLHEHLTTRGYAMIRSEVIDDVVVFVRDDSVALPARCGDKVRFTLDELKLMIGSSPEALRQIHEVKRIFGGKVVPSDGDLSGARSRVVNPVSVLPAQQSLFSTGTAVAAQ